MNRRIISFLKRKGWTDINLVNRIFVSAFIDHYKIVPKNNELLIAYYITDEDDDSKFLKDFVAELKKNDCKYTLEELTQLFEFVISPSDRKISGAIYTPKYIRDKIVNEVISEYSVEELCSKRFADISCGCGGFFLSIVQLIHNVSGKKFAEIYRDNIYGIDIQDYSILRTQLLLSLLALINGEDQNLVFNLFQGNTLSFDFSKIPGIDIIVGNPPYVSTRNMSDENRKLLGNWRVCATGNSDLYIPFFQIAIEKVKKNGKVGLITMNSFMTSLNGRALREYLYEKSYRINIVDFRGFQMFAGKSTYTCLFFLTKTKFSSIGYCTNVDSSFPQSFKFKYFKYKLLDVRKGWKLNSLKHNLKLEKGGIPLGKYCKTRHGIATLANKVYIFRPIRCEEDNFVFEKEGIEYKVEQAICKKIINSNKFNSNVYLDDIIEYVIYPYDINTEGKAVIIEEDSFRHNYPLAYSYLQTYNLKLKQRDKGNIEKYPTWYAYGRSQSLVMPKYKLFFPKIANKMLHCALSDDPELLLYNGISFISDNLVKLEVLKRIMESSIFWEYIMLNSKPYSSGYYSLNGINIINFNIFKFSKEQIHYLINIQDKEEINRWLRKFYE